MDAAQNLELNSRELQQAKIQLESLPVVVNFATTSRCNMNPPCVMCLRNVEEHPQDMTWATLFRAGYIAHTASAILLHGVGEPLLYPRLFDVASIASEDALTLFTTNGIFIGRYVNEICDHISKISVSIDAASKKMYKRIRHESLSTVKNGIAQVVAMKRERNQETPAIDISMCLMRSNVGEMADFVEMAYELGVDTVHFYHMNDGPEYDWEAGWFDYQMEHCWLDSETHDRNVFKALDKAGELGVPIIFDGTRLFDGKTDFPFADNPCGPGPPEHDLICDAPWRNIQINSDGEVMNCCYQTWAIGDLREQSFAEVWNGKTQKGIREGIITKNFHDYCVNAKCPPKGRI